MISTVKNKLIINQINVKETEQPFYQEVTAQDLDIININFVGPIVVDLNLFKSGDTIVVSGAVKFQVLLNCANCLTNYTKNFSENIYQEFIRSIKSIISTNARLEDVDFIREYYTADFFDLAPLIHDTILLALPIAPWCREDCPGIVDV